MNIKNNKIKSLLFCIFISFFLVSPVISQPGSREFHIPFSEEIVSPHVKWAKPYDLGKTRALFVPSIAAGRSVIELAQRFDLDYETVCIDEDWVVNHWSYNMNYSRTTRHSLDAFKQPYSYLLKALQDGQYDVIVLPSIRGWNEMPPELRQLIMDRVKDGMGLVLIHPYEGHYPETQFLNEELQPYSTMYRNMKQVPVPKNPVKGTLWSISPLINCPNNPISAKGHVIINRDALRSGAWRKVSDHFIVNGAPLEFYPYDFMKYYKYSVSPSAKVLIESDSGDPVCAVQTYGKGRVVAFGFFNYGAIPLVDKKSYEAGKSDIYWEYYFSLLGRSLLWAAGKDYGQQVDFDKIAQDVFAGEFKTGKNNYEKYGLPAGSELGIVLRNESGQIEQEMKPGKSAKIAHPVNAGRYIVEMIVYKNNKVAASECKTFMNDSKMTIENIKLDKNDYNDPDVIRGQVIFSSISGPEKGAVVLELLDNYGRVIQQKQEDYEFSRSLKFDFKAENFATRCGWVRCSVLDESKKIQDTQKKFFWIKSANLGKWDEFMSDMRWSTYVPIVYPWQKSRDMALRRMGVNLLDDPYTNFEISYRSPRNWGRDPEGELYLGWEEKDGPNAQSLPWFEKYDGYNLTQNKSYLVREPCLSDPEYQEKQIKVLQKIAAEFKRYGTTWYDLTNEASLLSGIPPLDFCYSGFCLHNFREYLKRVYGNLESLNHEYETEYTDWNDVMPQTLEDAQKAGNYAPWADHKRFMQVMWAERIKQFGDVVRGIDPEARVCLTNVRRSDPYIGVDHYLQEQSMECIRPKEYYHQDFRSDILTFGGSGYAEIGEASKSSFLPGVMDGQVGTSAWWYFGCFDPDLTPSKSGEDLTEYYQLVMSGLGKLMLNVERVSQPIVMHYSFPSGNAVWITDGNRLKRPYSKNFERFFKNRTMWDQLLSELGFQYSWIASEQLEQGSLNTGKYKVFILPNSIALSDKEVEQIKKFVQDGGVLIADAQPGLMDEHAKWLETGALNDIFGSPVAKDPVDNVSITANYGQGKVYLLNRFVTDFQSDTGLVSDISQMLTDAGIIAPVKIIAANGKQLTDCETFYYKKGDIDYVGIVRGVVENKDKVPVTIELPEKKYVYESLSGKYIGFTDKFQDELVSSDIRLFSLLPDKSAKWSLKFNKNKVKQGEALEYTLTPDKSSSGDMTIIFKIDVLQPDGSVCQWNSKNILVTAKSGATVPVNIALNEQKGKWRIKATEFQTGQSIEKTFKVF